jgi:hypothetical protein
MVIGGRIPGFSNSRYNRSASVSATTDLVSETRPSPTVRGPLPSKYYRYYSICSDCQHTLNRIGIKDPRANFRNAFFGPIRNFIIQQLPQADRVPD